MPLRTISRAGEVEEKTERGACPTSDWISRMTWSGGRLRDLPRTWGMTQKEQRLLQPSWIFRMGRVWWDSPPWMGAERNSGWAKMSPVRIWAGTESAPRGGALASWGAEAGASPAPREWK